MVAFVAIMLLAPSATSGMVMPDYNCTAEPPVAITYQVTAGEYNGAVHCGSLLLKQHAHAAPHIKWRIADPSLLYTLVMLDPDAGNGTWPDVCCFGDPTMTPLRHWVVGNINGSSLAKGFAGSAASQVGDVLWPYSAPRISAGSHRYGFFLFAQKKREKFEPVTGLPTHWDADAYLKQYQMSVLDKATSNYYILMYDGTPDDPFPPSPPH